MFQNIVFSISNIKMKINVLWLLIFCVALFPIIQTTMINNQILSHIKSLCWPITWPINFWKSLIVIPNWMDDMPKVMDEVTSISTATAAAAAKKIRAWHRSTFFLNTWPQKVTPHIYIIIYIISQRKPSSPAKWITKKRKWSCNIGFSSFFFLFGNGVSYNGVSSFPIYHTGTFCSLRSIVVCWLTGSLVVHIGFFFTHGRQTEILWWSLLYYIRSLHLTYI